MQIDVKSDSFFALKNRGGSAETVTHATNAKQPTVLYNQNHQDNLINNSRTGSPCCYHGLPTGHFKAPASGNQTTGTRCSFTASAAQMAARSWRGATEESREPLHVRL